MPRHQEQWILNQDHSCCGNTEEYFVSYFIVIKHRPRFILT